MKLKTILVILTGFYLGWVTSEWNQTHEWRCVWNQISYGVPVNPAICPHTDHE